MKNNADSHKTIVCPSPKVWDFDKERLHWASVVRGPGDGWHYPSEGAFKNVLYRKNNERPNIRLIFGKEYVGQDKFTK